MTKKIRDEDDFDDEMEDNDTEFDGNTVDNNDDDDHEDECEKNNNTDNGDFSLDEDDDSLDIVIEIDEDDLDLIDDGNTKEENTEDDIVLSKHKIEGKHSLKYDSIFKGKKETPLDEDDMDGFLFYHKETIEVDKSSSYYFESMDNENYIRSKAVKEKVYDVLVEHTDLNFLNNRRKPSKIDFNHYYSLLKTNLVDESFTNIELFDQLAVYFSDNTLNMFKLLDNKWRNLIIKEMQDHIGRNVNSKDVTNRNIYENTEIEFVWEDEYGNDKIITGVVIETDYLNSIFKVDSYENVYDVPLANISKILNNEKFKYNLNKLNNIDFL
jgi:hypothetical protein